MFKKDFERTPQEKARRSQFSILARLGGCGYLVYIMVQLLQTPEEERTTLMIVLAVVLLAASAVVIAITLYDLFRALKTGRFNPAFYEDAMDCAVPQTEDASPAELEDGDDDDDDDDDDDAKAHEASDDGESEDDSEDE